MNIIRRSILNATRPIDRRPTVEWAADHFECVAPLSIRNTTFKCANSRHFIAPLNSLDNDAKREVAVRAPVRSAKTLMAEVFAGDRIVRDPGPMMWVAEKDPLADLEWARMEGLFEASPLIRERLPPKTPQGSRRDKKTGAIYLLNGFPFYLHGSAVSNLQQKAIRFLFLDEVWNWQEGRMDEALGRIGDYLKLGVSKVFIISQGGFDGSDWDRYYSRGSCSHWEVECQSCHQFFQPLWTQDREDGKRAGMKWDEHKDLNGLWIPALCLNSIRFECPHCLHPHTETAKVKEEWNRTGRYVQTNFDARPERDSYTWTNVIDYPWRELVDTYLHAINALKMGNAAPLITFFQKHMAQNKSEQSILEAAVSFSRQAYDIRSKWDDELARFFTVDVQETVFYGEIRQWSKDGRSRRLWIGRLTSYADIEQKRVEFNVKPRLTALDSGHKAKGDRGVYAACVRYGWLALKGDHEKVFYHAEKDGTRTEHSFSELAWGDPELGTGDAHQGKKAPLIRFSSDVMADRMDQQIQNGLWSEPLDDGSKLEADYKRQMSAEIKREFEDPKTHRRFFKRVLLHKDNHFYDCGKMQECIATLSNILPDKGQ